MQGWFNQHKLISAIWHIKKSKTEIRYRKSLWQNSTSLHDKIPEETSNRRTYLKIKKAV
jgi:hypothetical protein